MLKIDYQLTGSGWATCTIHADGRECALSASYLTDSLGKLVLAGVAILAGAQSISIGFDEEPGEYRWALVVTDNDVLRVDVLEFDELWSNQPDVEGTLLFSFTCKPLEFGKAVRDAADQLFTKHGLDGYKKRWVEHDFPIAELALLRSHILRCEW